MELANTLIRSLYASGWSNTIYNGVVIFAFFVQLLFLLFYGKKYQLTKLQSAITVLIVYPLGYFGFGAYTASVEYGS